MLGRLAGIVAAAMLLAGCGSTIFTELVRPPGKDRTYFQTCLRNNGFLPGDFSVAAVAQRLREGVIYPEVWPDATPANAPFGVADERMLIGELSARPGYVNLFLDCYVAKVDQANIEGRLLRGHILTTLLAQYASASLIAKEKATKSDDAATIMAHIRRAEILLISLSPEALTAIYGLKRDTAGDARLHDMTLRLMPNFRNAQRVAAVFDIGIDIARVDGRFVAGAAGNLFDVVSGAVSGGPFNPALAPKVNELFAAAVAGLQLAAQSELYGGAFIRDAQLSLLDVALPLRGPPPENPVGEVWQAWLARINAACDSLRGAAGDNNLPCQPSTIDMVNFLKREYPTHPYLPALKDKAAAEVKK